MLTWFDKRSQWIPSLLLVAISVISATFGNFVNLPNGVGGSFGMYSSSVDVDRRWVELHHGADVITLTPVDLKDLNLLAILLTPSGPGLKRFVTSLTCEANKTTIVLVRQYEPIESDVALQVRTVNSEVKTCASP